MAVGQEKCIANHIPGYLGNLLLRINNGIFPSAFVLVFNPYFCDKSFFKIIRTNHSTERYLC